jgi:2-polyprenyl-3-methyl-5-hydroxy-6-metoxy-1,4-benzoquinol methylase
LAPVEFQQRLLRLSRVLAFTWGTRLKDKSNGYEAVAQVHIRTRRSIGAAVVRNWASLLPRGASILDIGCGHGVPISQALIENGYRVYGVDASPTMIAAFRERFANACAECSAVEDSDFFGRAFDGVVAWGLMFLLPADLQQLVIRKVSQALKEKGTFLFTSPRHACTWTDAQTGRQSISLGFARYRKLLSSEGLTITGTRLDEGDNHYYFASKTS